MNERFRNEASASNVSNCSEQAFRAELLCCTFDFSQTERLRFTEQSRCGVGRWRRLANVTVIEGDVLKVPVPSFSKVIAIPPYYLSSRLVMWLLDRDFECAVLIFQQEFARRLVAEAGTDVYGWLTIVARHSAAVELLDAVPKSMFIPPPEVDSVIVRLTPWKKAPFEVEDEAFFRRMVRWLFTQRNKKLGNALAPFLTNVLEFSKEDAKNLVSGFSFRERRVRELAPEVFGELANALVR
jgi:16S rRNA (adenine1518-N6/adenine1519-N6)-dimethyltransferase